jgi:tetratricopeptide (TPR) repeat protein
MVLGAFCCGLMSKSMIVTLPCVLLLLDVWPLRRANRRAVLWEKLPLAACAFGVALATYVSQRQAGAVRSLGALPFGLRAANAVVTYVVYAARTIWPAKLAVYYPYDHNLPVWLVVGAGALLAGITVPVLRQWRRFPYLAVGWLWYLGTLVPVIGLIQVGGQSSADRYTYLPIVGLTIMLSWGMEDLLQRYPRANAAAASLAVAACSTCVVLTYFQVSTWANSGTLFQHAVDATSGNYIAENNLADYYLTNMRNDEALAHVMEALRLKPDYVEAHVNLGTIFRRTGKAAESESEYMTALTLQPESVDAHSGYGALLLSQGRKNEALREFEKVVELSPQYPDGHYDLGRLLDAVGRRDDAMAQFFETIRLRPDHAEARHSLGVSLVGRGRLDEALAQFRAESQLEPGNAGVRYTMGQVLASVGRTEEAIAQFSAALRIKPDFAAARRGLEAAQARRGGR